MKTKPRREEKTSLNINIGDRRVDWVLDHTGVLHYECYPKYSQPPGLMSMNEFRVLKGLIRTGKVKGVVCWLNELSFDLYASDTVKDFSRRQVLCKWLSQQRNGMVGFYNLKQLCKMSAADRQHLLLEFERGLCVR